MKECPRCKELRLMPDEILNSLSRRASVYICNACGDEEAMIDLGHIEPTQLEIDFLKTHKPR